MIPIQLNLRIIQTTDTEATERAIRALLGVISLVAVFPGHEDPDLATLYVLKVESARLAAVWDTLKQFEGVRKIEPIPGRKARGN